jgi:hypothetical protein
MKYSDIGHNDLGSAMVWLYTGRARKGGLEWSRATKGTHETIFGPTYVKHWRGRIDLQTRVCSVKAPEGEKDVLCPEWLRKTLVDNFGGADQEVKIVNFGHGEWSVEDA